jgi:stage II sporulation protein D
MRSLVVTFFLLLSISANAERILVGLHYGSDYLRATVTVASGSYDVYCSEQKLFEIRQGQSADITSSSGKVNIFYDGKNYTDCQKVVFSGTGSHSFKVLPAGHKPNGRIYNEDLIAYSYNGRLQLVNKIDIEEYVSGVIEAESGKGNELEYYKVQAVISRTYALNNKTRHMAEGFELCDATHCQVYHGKPRAEPLAHVATETTRDIVIVDHEIKLITAAFHSNCGGKTINAEEVWSKSVPYLVGRPDTFCLAMPHSSWEKTISYDKWNTYLRNKRSSIAESTQPDELNLYKKQKLMYCVDSSLCIPLRTMREDLKLRSTTFIIDHKPEEVKFMGQGFGHGVGLCQEGAMRMTILDYCYEDIIHFYYRDVHLIPRYMMWFFQEEN